MVMGRKDPTEFRDRFQRWKNGENPYSAGRIIDAIYKNNPKEEFLGEPSHNYDFTQSEEWANARGYYPDERGHRDDRVKKPAHPSHPSRGTWDGDKFVLTDKGMQDPNYTLFGLNDGGQDPQAILTHKGSTVLPEITVTPKGNYIYNSYDNIKLHLPKYANGKLPGYKDGKPKGDGMKYSWDDQTQSWDRYTGDAMGEAFNRLAITPQGNREKFNYERQPIAQHIPKIETDQDYTERRINETTKNNTPISDAFHIAVGFIPGVGDARDAIQAGVSAVKGDYLTAGVLGGGLLIPNALQYGWKTFKNISPLKIANFEEKLRSRISGVGAGLGFGGGAAVGIGLTNSLEKEKQLSETQKAEMAGGTAMLGLSGGLLGWGLGDAFQNYIRSSSNVRSKSPMANIIRDILTRPISTIHARSNGNYPITFKERRQFVNNFRDQITDAWRWTVKNNKHTKDMSDNDMKFFYGDLFVKDSKKIDDYLQSQGASGQYAPYENTVSIKRRLNGSNLPNYYSPTQNKNLLPQTYGTVAAHEFHHHIQNILKPYRIDVLKRDKNNNLIWGPDASTKIGQLYESALSKNAGKWEGLGDEFTAELQAFKYQLGINGSMFSSSKATTDKILNALSDRFGISTDQAKQMALEYEKILGVLK